MTREYKFEVGQLVRVKDPGQTYTAYGALFDELKFANRKDNPSVPSGTVGQVFGRTSNESYPKYGIVTMDGQEVLIGELGIEECIFERPKPAKEVEISTQYVAVITKEHVKVGCQTVDAKKLQNIIAAAIEVGLIK